MPPPYAISQAEDADASLLQAMPLARQLKQRILSERQLTAPIGIASNKLLAKIASDHKKPDGLTVITDQEKVSFLRPLPEQFPVSKRNSAPSSEAILHQNEGGHLTLTWDDLRERARNHKDLSDDN